MDVTGLEPVTSTMSTWRSSQLIYTSVGLSTKCMLIARNCQMRNPHENEVSSGFRRELLSDEFEFGGNSESYGVETLRMMDSEPTFRQNAVSFG